MEEKYKGWNDVSLVQVYCFILGIHLVCQACLLHNPYIESLLECTCFNTTLHDGVYPIVSVAWNENEQMMAQIRPLPQLSLQLKGFALCNSIWCKGENYCTFAHSELEKMAWNYEINLMKRGIISITLTYTNKISFLTAGKAIAYVSVLDIRL